MSTHTFGTAASISEPSGKTERVEARVTPEQKQFFAHAAALTGCSFTDFVVRALQAAAEETVQRHQVMKLSAMETQAFAEAFLNPREPNEALKKYSRRERELLGE